MLKTALASRHFSGRLPRRASARSFSGLPRLNPLAATLAMAFIAGAAAPQAHAQAAGGAWFATGGAAAQARSAARQVVPGLPPAMQQRQQARAKLERSVANVGATAAAIAAKQAAMAAARASARNEGSAPNGLVQGGLWDRDAAGNQLAWTGADRSVHNVADGKHRVTIKQTAEKAILNWDTFNVGRDTTVAFEQKPTDAVLNRVVGATVRPSQIQGAIKGDGTVMVVNQNGVVFSGTSQVNVRNLVAAAANITDSQFMNYGIYGDQGTVASFTGAGGNVLVQAGARIATKAPDSVTQGGGYVLLLGREVSNAGEINTPRGQALLAAGDEFVIRKGYATDANTFSTTRGNEVVARRLDGVDANGNPVPSVAGKVGNTGLIIAQEGDITLTGHDVNQAGVVIATTTVNTRGTIHLLNSASDATGRITLGGKATTAVVLQDQGQTALDSQRQALIDASAELDLARASSSSAVFDNLSRMPDRRDLSRIEIVSGQHVDFRPGSLTLATGGQVSVSAVGRTQVQTGATLDVSGSVGVQVAMAANNIEINIQGNEQRDAPVNRDSGKLNNSNAWIDRRKLIYVPGTDNDGGRWYTAGGLLEVGGYLGNQAHGIGEWAAQGGMVTLGGTEIVTQRGSVINLAGGTLDVQNGYVNQSWMRGADGRLYELSSAPGDMLYEGLYLGYERVSQRWGQTDAWRSPLIAPQRRWEEGYTVGRDAGRLILSSATIVDAGGEASLTAVIEGDIDASVYQGARQVEAVQAGLSDGYLARHTAVARAGGLALMSQAYTDSESPLLSVEPARHVVLGEGDVGAPASLREAFDASFAGTVYLDVKPLNDAALGSVVLLAAETASLDAALTLAPGGALHVTAAKIDVRANVTAPAGSIVLTNQRQNGTGPLQPTEGRPAITLHAGATLDTRGLWTNLSMDDADRAQPWRLAYVDGGSVTLRSSGDLTLERTSRVDASAGGAILTDGGTVGGAGGDIVLVASDAFSPEADRGNHGDLRMDGTVVSNGFTRGGRLTLQTGGILSIGGEVGGMGDALEAGTPAPYVLTLHTDTVLPAGVVLPIDVTANLDTVPAGGTLPAGYWSFVNYGLRDYKDFNGNGDTEENLVTKADWTNIPVQMTILGPDGAYFAVGQGETVPAGSQIVSIYAGHIESIAIAFPTDVFPQGVPIRQDEWTDPRFLTVPVVFAAGSRADMDLTLVAGTLLPVGTRAVVDLPVQSIMATRLDPSFFTAGFSDYSINGQTALIVTPGTQIRPVMPRYRFTQESALAPTGSHPAVAVDFGLDAVYRQNPGAGELTRRAGASLALHSSADPESVGVTRTGTVLIDRGAHVEVDPGSSISISSGGQITVQGALVAPGGSIDVVNNYAVARGATAAQQHPGALSIWIGEQAVLDAAGRAYAASGSDGRRYGVASDGGRITVGSTGGQFVWDDGTTRVEPGNERSSHAYVVLRPGSILDVSGASVTVDLPTRSGMRVGSKPVTLQGDGGSIALRSYAGIHADGTLRAFGGGSSAAGGALLMSLESPLLLYPSANAAGTPEFQALRAGRVLTVGQFDAGPALAADATPGQRDAGFLLGQAGIGADQITAGGFDAVTLRARDALVFDDDVNLSLGRSLTLESSQYANLSGGTVTLAAPHVLLHGASLVTAPQATGLPDQVPHYTQDGLATGKPLGATFSVAGQLVDISNAVQVAYADTRIASSGDLRLLSGGAQTNYDPASGQYSLITTPTYLTSVGDLTLTGRRIYGASGVEAILRAGYSAGQNLATQVADAVLTIASPDHAGPHAPAPYSAFSKLTLQAGDIVQGGALYAPFGAIVLHAVKMAPNEMATVRLLSGSLTSASGAGLIMPYGGTSDGTTWKVDGAAAALVDLISGNLAKGGDVNFATQGLSIDATHIRSDAGAVVDLSGGGTLTGAAFVAGRGGSLDRLTTPLSDGGRVYAIVPTVDGAAPVTGGSADAWTGAQPDIGQQITIGSGVPGLSAGTYTLMPANYALLPGAYRVELGGAMMADTPDAVALRNGTYLTYGYQSVADTGIRDVLPTRVSIMPAATLRRYSQYNETSYSAFQLAQADTFNRIRPALEADGKRLVLAFAPWEAAQTQAETEQVQSLQWQGAARLAPAQGGYGGSLAVLANGVSPGVYQDLILTGDAGTAHTRAFGRLVLKASDLNAIGAPSLYIGGTPMHPGKSLDVGVVGGNGGSVGTLVLEEGALLTGGQVFLTVAQEGTIRLEAGSRIDTRAYPDVPLLDSSVGYYFGAGTPMLAVSNGAIDLALSYMQFAAGSIELGDGASIYTRGSIGFLSRDGASFEGAPRLAAQRLDIAAASINVGSSAELAEAKAKGVLPEGFNLGQDLLTSLVAGDAGAGLAGVRNLTLNANTSLNVYGSVDLNVLDGSGKSMLDSLTFNVPAIYGAGDDADVAHLRLDEFIWNTSLRAESYQGDGTINYGSALPGATIAGGPGHGQGTLLIDARRIVLGHPERNLAGSSVVFDHLMLGFSDVTLSASEQISSVDKNTLSLWQSGPDPSTVFEPETYAGVGGALTLITPLLTAGAGGEAFYRAGGAMVIRAPEGAAPAAVVNPSDALGGRISLNSGGNMTLDTAIVLPSGRLVATAEGDILLGANSRLDVAGRTLEFFDITRHTWGGDVLLESVRGNIVQQVGSVIDVSAANDVAGTLAVTAKGENAGRVALDGTLSGSGSSSRFGGAIDVRAQVLGENAADLTQRFAALNTSLNAGGFTARRSLGIGQGSLTIGDELRAHEVSVSVDGGSLTVAGLIDASGDRPGTIRLAARDDLRLAGSAQLDARGKVLQVDGYGQAIEATNRSHVELASREGWLTLEAGSTLDLSSPDGVLRGQVQLDAGRTDETSGDLRVNAGGPLNIVGAQGIFLNAVQRYTLPGGSVIDQSMLDGFDAASQRYILAAYGDDVAGGRLVSALQTRLAGLTASGTAFHLRPGVEIASDGDLRTSGDLDLSGYRYGPNADRNLDSSTYGAGEAMSLVLRAAGNLEVTGSISDGFRQVPGVPPTLDRFDDLALTDTRYFTYFDPWFFPQGYYALSSTLPATVSDPAGWTVPYLPDGSPLPDNLLPGDNVDEWAATRFASGTHLPYGTMLYLISVPNTLKAAYGGLSVQTDAGLPTYGAASALAHMQASGTQSSALRLVAGADIGAASSRTLRAFGSVGAGGDLVLNNPRYDAGGIPIPSVVRTGTGALDLLAGGDFKQQSLYGIYTAGTDTGAVDVPAGSYLADHGGDLTLVAQGNATGYNYTDNSGINFQAATNWLVRRGDSETNAVWAVRFGATLATSGWQASSYTAGFGGIGTLGGGNVTVVTGGNAGTLNRTIGNSGVSEYEALALVVGAGGQVTSVTRDADIITGGTLRQTGGGDLRVRVGGVFNGADNRGSASAQAEPGSMSLLANMRGAIDLSAGSIGLIQPNYAAMHIADPRSLERTSANGARAIGGIALLMGNSAVSVRTAGDLVLGSVADPGQVALADSSTYFALWQPATTRLGLFSAGGNLVPWTGSGFGGSPTAVLPAKVEAVAASRSIYYGSYFSNGDNAIELAPSPVGGLSLLAYDSIYAAGLSSGAPGGTMRINISGAGSAPNDAPNPFRPVSLQTGERYLGYFQFQDNTPARQEHAGDSEPIRIYAVKGDLQSVALGQTASVYDDMTGQYATRYIGAKSARILAGRDIVNFGKGTGTGNESISNALIMNVNDTDVSVIHAGRDIFHANVDIAGPGTLEVTADGNIYQADKGAITSIGPLVPGDARPGADIAIMAGAGSTGPDYAAFAARYLDPSNQADLTPGNPLADQPGKVAHTYQDELIAWLAGRYGYRAADSADALAYFAGLAPEQQRILVRQVYFAELKAGGREYNDAAGPRLGSYLRGRQTIAALFPDEVSERDTAGQVVNDAQGNPVSRPVVRGGDLTMFGGSGLRTLFGGDIHTMVPAGRTVVGVEGLVPPGSAGVVTQGQGDIGMYSRGSILLGLSRIMTTFGGSILAWSAQGDINAGRGSKTTAVYTPPKRVYDDAGNVTLSPDVPSSGAGIATLNPIPEAELGDVDLIAPLGTIDAGEAGIRVSGNVNIAALQVVNAANIQVQGDSAGIPALAAVNVGALTSASAAATSAATAAQETVQRARAESRQNLPSIINVQILGFGSDASPPAPGRRSDDQARGPTGDAMVQVVGRGRLSADQLAKLTLDERQHLGL